MIKNRYFAALAMAGLVSFAACGGEGGEAEGEGTAVEDTAAIAPVTPAPVVTDTAATGAMPMDTGAAAGATTDTAAAH